MSSAVRSGSSASDSATPVTQRGFIEASLARQNSRMTVSSSASSLRTRGQSTIVPPLVCSLASPPSMARCLRSPMLGPQDSRVRLRARPGSASTADRATNPPRQCPITCAGRPPVTAWIRSRRSPASPATVYSWSGWPGSS